MHLRATPICLLFALVPLAAPAQLKLEGQLEFTTYVQYEPIRIASKVVSELGTPAVFNISETDPRFYYQVTDAAGLVFPRREGAKQPHPVMIQPRASETITNNLLDVFAVHQPGYYSVQPCVDWRGKTFRGAKSHFEIVSGREVSRATGIVRNDGSTRVYRLLHVNRNLQDHLLLRVDDEEAHLCYGVVPLGRTIISDIPELAVDAAGVAHVVYRSSPQNYVYAKFNPMGYQMDARNYGRGYADIDLLSRPDGSIVANASIESRKGTDVPLIQSVIERDGDETRER